MLVLTIISLLIGVILGLRFKVIVLVPAFGLALALIALSGIVMEEGVWRPVSTTVAVATFLQLGYICGSILRIAFYRTRVADHGRASMPPQPRHLDPASCRSEPSGRFKTTEQLHHT
jgi:hypothetical protein